MIAGVQAKGVCGINPVLAGLQQVVAPRGNPADEFSAVAICVPGLACGHAYGGRPLVGRERAECQLLCVVGIDGIPGHAQDMLRVHELSAITAN